jgi:hypothetical protein
VISSIVHIAHKYDNDSEPWPIHIEDHNGVMHAVALKEGDVSDYCDLLGDGLMSVIVILLFASCNATIYVHLLLVLNTGNSLPGISFLGFYFEFNNIGCTFCNTLRTAMTPYFDTARHVFYCLSYLIFIFLRCSSMRVRSVFTVVCKQ